MVVAGRSYYDSLAKIGDISADSPVSKELGKWLFNFFFLTTSKHKLHFCFPADVSQKCHKVEKYWEKSIVHSQMGFHHFKTHYFSGHSHQFNQEHH